jgi:hypothetical protein
MFLEEGKKERKLVRQCYALIYINRSLFTHALLLFDLAGWRHGENTRDKTPGRS